MNSIYIYDNKLGYEVEKGLFRKKKIINTIEFKSIQSVGKNHVGLEFVSLQLFFNNNDEVLFDKEEYNNIESLYEKLFEKKDEYNYEIIKFDIENCVEEIIHSSSIIQF